MHTTTQTTATGSSPPHRARVLLIDDDDAVRSALRRVLHRADYDVVEASDGASGLEAAARERFDVAIVDYEMPPPTGVEVLHQLRDLQPGCSRILSSGRADVPVITSAVNHGEISRVLPKPVSPTHLCEAVAGAIAAQARTAERHDAVEAQRRDDEYARLQALLDGPDLRLAVQPIVSADDGVPFAYEALLRSQNEEFPGPFQVLQACEAHGKTGDLAARVAGLAGAWLEEIPRGRKLFVNLHPEELRDPDALAARLEPLRPVADRIVLEITERSGAQGTEHFSRSVAVLREMGFALAVDDLGAGYSSLAILAEVKPEFIKIDMSIIRDVDSDMHKRHIVELVCRFADATNSTVVAEGIETQAEASAVRECGAKLMQGYFFARPSLELAAAEG